MSTSTLQLCYLYYCLFFLSHIVYYTYKDGFLTSPSCHNWELRASFASNKNEFQNQPRTFKLKNCHPHALRNHPTSQAGSAGSCWGSRAHWSHQNRETTGLFCYGANLPSRPAVPLTLWDPGEGHYRPLEQEAWATPNVAEALLAYSLTPP